MQLTARHFYGTLICAQAQEWLQLMRGPLGAIRKKWLDTKLERGWSPDGVAAIVGILVLVAPRQSRHEGEAAEFERILESAAWPPGEKGSVQVGV